LGNIVYLANATLNLRDIGEDEDSLRCLTPNKICCRNADHPNNNSRGDWKFPNGSTVQSKSKGVNISRSRGASSVLLHRSDNVTSPTGVYSCEVVDMSNTTIILNVYLYVNQASGIIMLIIQNSVCYLPIVFYTIGLYSELDFNCQLPELTCTVHGGLVIEFNWTRDGEHINSSDPLFTQSVEITNRLNVTSELVLRNNHRSKFQGTFQCFVKDGLDRISVATIHLNGMMYNIKCKIYG